MIHKIKQTVRLLIIPAVAAILSLSVVQAVPTYADSSCGTETAILHCPNTVKTGTGDIKQTAIWGILLIAIGILTAGIGVAALAGIVYGIILYTSSGGDPSGIKKAMEVIRNVVIGVVAYALMWSALNWLIPGGVFN